MNHRTNVVSVPIAIGVLYSMPVVCSGGPLEQAAFFETLRQRVPERGAIHAHFLEPATGNRVLAGFDFESGAYYKAFESFVGGKDTSGAFFSGEPVLGRVRFDSARAPASGDSTLDQFIPLVVAWDFLKRPDLVESVSRETDGFIVSIRRPRGMRHEAPTVGGADMSPQVVVHHFDNGGLLLSIENYCGSRSEMKWDYSDASLREKGLASVVSLGTRQVIDWRIESSTRQAGFSKDAVENLAVAAALIEGSQPLWFGKPIASLTPQTRDGKPAPLPPVTMTPSQAAAGAGNPPPESNGLLQWSLIGGGVAVVALAVWVKRRGA